MELAFVLLSRPGLPKGNDVVRAFTPFAHDNQRLLLQPAGTKAHDRDVLAFEVRPCGTAFVASMPAPVPAGEADDAVKFSISSIGTGWQLPSHAAHLLVTLPDSGAARVTSLSCFTALLAAVTQASPAVGIYWGNAGATHDPAFFVSIAQEPALASHLMLWTGVSIAREVDGRLSLLSLGMRQLDLPDLLLVTPRSMGNDALATFFDLLAYVAQRGEPIREGDTVGRSAEERLPVHYTASPIDPSKQVWRVEIK